MKTVFKVLIPIGTIVVLLGGFSLGLFINGKCFEGYDASKTGNENWMGNIKDEVKLNDVVMPGSHDSGTYGMFFMAETQTFTLEQQLKVGARYFDLRVNKDGDKYVIYHSAINGVEFFSVLESIKSFISIHNTETLLLDFQHFAHGAESYVFEQVESELADYLLKKPDGVSDLEYLSNVSVGEVRGKCIVFSQKQEYIDNKNFVFSRDNDDCSNGHRSLDSYYVTSEHTIDAKSFINTTIPKAYDKIKKKINNTGNKGIFILQSQLTDGAIIFGPYSREKSLNSLLNDYFNNYHLNKSNPEVKEKLDLLNIVMRDFINFDKCKSIIDLNSDKGNFKTT